MREKMVVEKYKRQVITMLQQTYKYKTAQPYNKNLYYGISVVYQIPSYT